MPLAQYNYIVSDIEHCGAINRELLSQERWQTILRCKEDFLTNDQDPSRCPYMDQEVAASWIRSRRLGVNPYEVATGPNLHKEQLSEILKSYQELIDITCMLSKTFKDILINCGYILYLFDKNGVILLNEGSFENFPALSQYSCRTGIVADEKTEGTTAHELCIRLKRPVQLVGPEHYCIAFQHSIASAAPIKDENGEILAALGLVSEPLPSSWGEENLKWRGAPSLGLVTSMAISIETQLKLQKTSADLRHADIKMEKIGRQLEVMKDKLVRARNILNTASECMDEGIVTMDSTGQILSTNLSGARIFRLSPEDVNNRNISDFLDGNSCLLALARKGENILVEERLNIGTDKSAYYVNIRPVINRESQQLEAVVLKLSSCEKSSTHPNSKANNTAGCSFEDIIGEDKEFKKNIALARRFAVSPENILLSGESGTGKELYAQAIHTLYRPQGPFVAVNCAAMPRELIESELFGYEGGSFTGAERSGRPGKIELAHGGTLFLDEIGDMPLELQAVLLRVLEDKKIMRIGGSRYKKVDFRLIAATNKNLHQMVKNSKFREDLYFRLSVLTVNIPPLRDRGNDAILLSKFFIENYCRKYGRKIPEISQATQQKISQYSWPGNIRQLQNAMIYAVNTARDDIIGPENLPNYILLETCPVELNKFTTGNGNVGDMLCLENLEKAAIETALVHANHCVPVAAEFLGISRSTLYRKLKEYSIEY